MHKKELFIKQVTFVYGQPSIQDQLPVVFENGQTLTDLAYVCSGCNNTVEDERFRGLVELLTPELVSVHAWANCQVCGQFSMHLQQFRSDGLVTTKVGHDWVTVDTNE